MSLPVRFSAAVVNDYKSTGKLSPWKCVWRHARWRYASRQWRSLSPCSTPTVLWSSGFSGSPEEQSRSQDNSPSHIYRWSNPHTTSLSWRDSSGSCMQTPWSPPQPKLCCLLPRCPSNEILSWSLQNQERLCSLQTSLGLLEAAGWTHWCKVDWLDHLTQADMHVPCWDRELLELESK